MKIIFAPTAIAGLALGLCAASPALADEARSTAPRFGAKLGIAGTTLSSDELEDIGLDPETKFGFAVGGVAVIPISGDFGLQAEALFAQRGANFDLGAAGDGSISTSYLQLPVLARYTIPAGGVSPYVYGGGSFALLLSAEGEADGDTEDIKDETSSFDFALVAGAGVEIPVATGAVTVEARYDLGLTNTDDSDEDVSGDINNRAFSLMVGYLF